MRQDRQPCAGYCECGQRIYGAHERCDACRFKRKLEREVSRNPEDEPRREREEWQHG